MTKFGLKLEIWLLSSVLMNLYREMAESQGRARRRVGAFLFVNLAILFNKKTEFLAN